MTQMLNETKKIVLEYLINEAYKPYYAERNKTIFLYGRGHAFMFRGEKYIHPASTQIPMNYLSSEEQVQFGACLDKWELIEDEIRMVKQHIVNYLNHCLEALDVYLIIPEELNSYLTTTMPPTNMNTSTLNRFKYHEIMEIYLDRIFLNKLEG